MSWISRTIAAISPNCRQAIRLQSDALDRKLPCSQRVGLGLHLLICKWCRRYARQVSFLHEAACDEHAHGPEKTLPPEARERINQAIKTVKNLPG